jgi:hypothetical protein
MGLGVGIAASLRALLMSQPDRDDHHVRLGRKAVDSPPVLGEHLRDE